MKYCQGPDCHTYETQDRIRGPKGDKHYETRRRTRLGYGDNFCSLICQDDWFRKFGTRAIDHFGRTTEPKRLVPENAWRKDYDWDWDNGNGGVRSNWRFVNRLTKERRPITQEQYDDQDFTFNQG